MRKGNVHVEWMDGSCPEDAKEGVQELVDLVRSGRKTDAIVHVCEATGIAWQEAKERVETLLQELREMGRQ